MLYLLPFSITIICSLTLTFAISPPSLPVALPPSPNITSPSHPLVCVPTFPPWQGPLLYTDCLTAWNDLTHQYAVIRATLFAFHTTSSGFVPPHGDRDMRWTLETAPVYHFRCAPLPSSSLPSSAPPKNHHSPPLTPLQAPAPSKSACSATSARTNSPSLAPQTHLSPPTKSPPQASAAGAAFSAMRSLCWRTVCGGASRDGRRMGLRARGGGRGRRWGS